MRKQCVTCLTIRILISSINVAQICFQSVKSEVEGIKMSMSGREEKFISACEFLNTIE